MPTAAALEQRSFNGLTVQVSPGAEADGFLVAFTERSGGVSTGPFEALNLGLRTEDDPARVTRNRALACEALGVDPFACAQQVHGARVERVGPRRAGAGFSDPGDAVAGADGLVTSSRRVSLSVVAADCVPLALVAPRPGRFAVVHAGWRGVASGIVTAAVCQVGDPGETRAVIGPAIGIDHYEVGENVAGIVAAATGAGATTTRSGGHLYLDLPGTVETILEVLGVRVIERSGECTACEPRRFFSYRRDGRTGRQALIAARL